MTPDLYFLATALYVKTDDLLKSLPQLAPYRPRVGIAPRLSDAELVTLAVMQALLGFVSAARWIRHARSHLRHLFPYVPKQPGYNKRLRKVAGLIHQVIRFLAVDNTQWTDDVWVVDSTPVECGRSRETVKRSALAGWAEYGYCASHSRYVTLAMVALACLSVTRAALADDSTTLLTSTNEIRRMFAAFCCPPRDEQHARHWSRWRHHHHQRASHFPYQRQRLKDH